MDDKRCPRCQVTKPCSEFHKDARNKDGLYAYCKECNKAKVRAWGAANPDKVREQGRRRREEGRERNSILLRKYGITAQHYSEMLAAQGGACAICGATEAGRGHRFLVVDHCHTSSQVRGLLCHSCNRGLGLFRDSAKLLAKAQAYLAGTAQSP
jgi:hypothetical protein